MSIHVFPSSRERTARANLDALVAKARACTALGPVAFDEPAWTVALVKAKRASSARAGVNKLYFTAAMAGSRSMEGRVPLPEPLARFVKTVVSNGAGTGPRIGVQLGPL